MQWLGEHGGRLDGCRAVAVPGMGTGLVASRDLREDETILFVPRACWLTRKTKQTRFEPLLTWAQDEGLFSHSMSRLALLVLLERYNPSSFFAPYLSALSPPTLPVSLSESEEAELQDPLLGTWIREQGKTVDEEWRRLSSALPHRFPDIVTPGVIDASSWHWAYGHVVQRTFTVDVDDEEVWVLVPGMDLCNHDSTSRNAYFAEEDGWHLETTRALGAGEPITIHYGKEKNSADFFLYYGFVPPDNVNDRVSLRLELDATDPNRDEKRDALELLGLTDKCRVGADGVLPTAFLNAALLWGLAGDEFRAEETDWRQPGFESRTLDRLAAVLEERLARFPTTLDEDGALSSSAPAEEWSRALVSYRIAYKRVLHGAADAIRTRAAGIRDGTIESCLHVPVDPEASYGLVDVTVRVGGR